MLRKITSVACLITVVFLAGCESKKEAATETAKGTQADGTQGPAYVTVQHVLVGFQGSVPGKPVTRSKEEAEQLANEVLKRAKAGEDFDELVKAYTADSHPGIYKLANHGQKGDPSKPIFERSDMVKGFGDVGFSLAVGEIDMVSYDPADSRFGWHIIKRLE